MKSVSQLVAVLALWVLPLSVFAQSPSPSPSAVATSLPTPSASPEASPTPAVSPSPLPPQEITDDDLVKSRYPWLTRLSSLFQSKKKAHYYKLRLQLANAYLLQAIQAQKAGDTAKAETYLGKYQQELQSVQAFISDNLNNQTATSPEFQALKQQLLLDNTVHIAALDSLMASTRAVASYNRKLANERLKILKKMNQILSSEKTPEEIEAKLEKLSERLTRKDLKEKEKLERKLAFYQELSAEKDEKEESAELEEKLKEKEQELLEKAAKDLAETELETILERLKEGNEERHLKRIETLKRVLERAPESAKPALEKTIQRFEEQALRQAARQVENMAQQGERTKKSLERLDEAKKKSDERKKETEKKLEERLKEGESKKSSSKSEVNVDVSGSGKVDLKVENNSRSVTESNVKTESNDVRLSTTITEESCGGNFTISKGANVKITVTNGTSSSLTYSIGSYGSVAVSPSENETLSFVASQTGSFTINCGGKLATLTVK